MNNHFEEERQFVLDLIKQGININIDLSTQQKKYIKNLLLFALMNASANRSEKDQNLINLVNSLFKTYLVQILKETFDDDDDWDEAISVALNNIIAKNALKNLTDFQEIFTPMQIFSFLKKHTSKDVQKDLLLQLKNMKTLEDDTEDEKEEKQVKERHKKTQKDLLLQLKALKNAKSNYRETPEEARKREQNRREYTIVRERQKILTMGREGRSR